jgi:hypothetical protein
MAPEAHVNIPSATAHDFGNTEEHCDNMLQTTTSRIAMKSTLTNDTHAGTSLGLFGALDK